MAEVKVSALTALTGANVANGDELYIVDTGSPNVSKKITADELAQMPQLSSRYVPLTSDVAWIPAGAFTVTAGSPSITAYATGAINWPAVLYDASSAEYAGSSAWLPAHWNTFHIDLYWTNAGGGSGNVVWTTLYQSFGDGDTTANLAGGNNTVTAPAQNVLKVSRTQSSINPTRGRPLFFVIGRLAADAADTLGNDAALIGVALVRAS